MSTLKNRYFKHFKGVCYKLIVENVYNNVFKPKIAIFFYFNKFQNFEVIVPVGNSTAYKPINVKKAESADEYFLSVSDKLMSTGLITLKRK